MGKKSVIMSIEPSKRLSEILGFPYVIERRFTVTELLSHGIIDSGDLCNLEAGQGITKKVKVLPK